MEFKARTIGMTDDAKDKLDAAAKATRLTRFEILSILLEMINVEGDKVSLDTSDVELAIRTCRKVKENSRKRDREIRAKLSKLSPEDLDNLLAK